MTLREDLERLAGECEVCALTDQGSVYDHMLFCPSCHQHELKAEEIERELTKMDQLASETDMERMHRFGWEVNDIIHMSDKERQNAVMDMFDNLGDLTERQRRILVKTHTDVLLSLPRVEREKLLAATRTVYASYEPDRLARWKGTIEAVTRAYGPIKRGMVRKMYNGIMDQGRGK